MLSHLQATKLMQMEIILQKREKKTAIGMVSSVQAHSLDVLSAAAAAAAVTFAL